MKRSALLLLSMLLAPVTSNAQQPPATDSKFPVFTTSAAAQHHCPFDVVVWLNTKLDTYSVSGPQAGDNPENGAYMCQGEADQMNYHPTQTSIKSR